MHGAPHTQAQFADLLEAHKGILYKICRVYCPHPDSREDLAQEIVLQLWRSFLSYDGSRCRFSTWMYRVALNIAISAHRRESARIRHLSPDPLLDIAAAVSAETVEVRMLYDMIERLEPLNRALLLLYLDGNSYAEIAEILGIRETNVATRLSRLKERMKQEMN